MLIQMYITNGLPKNANISQQGCRRFSPLLLSGNNFVILLFHLVPCIAEILCCVRMIFQLYTQAEQLGPDDAWHCPSCNRKQEVVKRLALWSSPDILIVHLKRFKQVTFLDQVVLVTHDSVVQALIDKVKIKQNFYWLYTGLSIFTGPTNSVNSACCEHHFLLISNIIIVNISPKCSQEGTARKVSCIWQFQL